MQDQKSEGRHRLAAGEVTTDLPPEGQSTVASPSTPTHTGKRDYDYYKGIFGNRPLPYAFLDLDLLEQNIRQIVARAQGKRVRLASKSLRSVAVIRRILAADPCFQGIMCYTAREAAYLASQGFDDLLIGYPTWNEQDIAAVALATAAGTHITLMVDSTDHVEQIETVAAHNGVRLPLCLEVDMSMHLPGLHFGVWRSPVHTPEQARPVLARIMTSSHTWLDGLMGYEAQIAGVGDNFPGHKARNVVVQGLKRRSIREIARRRAALVDLVKSYGLAPRFVNGGGTGSIATTRTEQAVTEITVGSGFYAPALGEETKNPHRNIPRAVFGSMIVVGLFYVLMAYVGTVGYGVDRMITGFANDPAPFDTIGRHYSGPFFVVLIDLVGLLSFFGAALAIINGGARIIYTVGRDGLFPGWTAWLHPVRRNPVGAIAGLCLFGLVVGLLLGFIMTPIGAFGFLGTLDALFVLIIYALVCIASIRFFWRERRAQFNIFRHGVVPVLGTLLILTIFAFVAIAPAPFPLNIIPFILAIWVLSGVGLLFVLRRKLVEG